MGIALKARGQIIGGIILFVDSPHDEASFAYLLNRTAWGQGYATEALAEILRFGFTTLGLQWIGDACARENRASARVMEKCGLRYVGEENGERAYAITVAEWMARWKVAP